ncbi:unnamed protein product [Boreogadus saida]
MHCVYSYIHCCTLHGFPTFMRAAMSVYRRSGIANLWHAQIKAGRKPTRQLDTHTPVPSDDPMSWDHVQRATWLSLDRASRGIDSSLPEPVSLSVCSLSLSHTVLRLLFVLVVRLSVYPSIPPPLSLLLTPGASVWR